MQHSLCPILSGFSFLRTKSKCLPFEALVDKPEPIFLASSHHLLGSCGHTSFFLFLNPLCCLRGSHRFAGLGRWLYEERKLREPQGPFIHHSSLVARLSTRTRHMLGPVAPVPKDWLLCYAVKGHKPETLDNLKEPENKPRSHCAETD